jgi:hypothetical protein
MCNIGKTIMMFAAPNQSYVKPMSLQFGASSLLPSPECRHLDVVIDAQLTLASHIRAVCKSARYHLWRISEMRRYLDIDSAKCLVHSLVLSRLDYANSLFSDLPEKLLDCLQAVQNAAARLICGGNRRDSARPLLKQLLWLPIRERVTFKLSTIVFRSLCGAAPAYLVQRLKKHIPGRDGLRNCSVAAPMLDIPRSRKARCGDRAFSVAAARTWNSLPESVRASPTLGEFKTKLKTHLCSLVFAVNS